MAEAVKKSFTDIIKTRYSCRKFTPEPIPAECIERLHSMKLDHPLGARGGKFRFRVTSEFKHPSFASLGMIRGAHTYIVGAVEKSKDCDLNIEAYGYCYEKIILEATRLGLQTCWFLESSFDQVFQDPAYDDKKEKICAVSPLGTSQAQSLIGSIFAVFEMPRTRYLMDKIAFFKTFEQPQTADDLKSLLPEKYQHALEMVRLGPSARNQQPWRIVITNGSGRMHLFDESRMSYYSRLDMGIAMCHLELALASSQTDPCLPIDSYTNVAGKWVVYDGDEVMKECKGDVRCSGWFSLPLKYVATWEPNQ